MIASTSTTVFGTNLPAMETEILCGTNHHEHTKKITRDETLNENDVTLIDPTNIELDNSANLLEKVFTQGQPGKDATTLEARLAEKEKQLKAARRELNKFQGEQVKLKQEIVSELPTSSLHLTEM